MAHKLNINDQEYEIPTRLSIEQYQTLLAFDWQDAKYYPMILASITGAPIDQLSKAPEDGLALGMSLIIQIMNQRTECAMLDLSAITFGQFIDLDVWFSLGLDKHLKDIADLLAPAGYYADELMWAIDKFAEFRVYTFRQYKVLFGITDKELDVAIEDGAEVVDKMNVARSWYRVIVALAGDNLLKIDSVTEEPLKKALNFMAYQKERVLEAEEKQRQQRRKYDLQRNR
jgi:hypothetical protein